MMAASLPRGLADEASALISLSSMETIRKQSVVQDISNSFNISQRRRYRMFQYAK